MPDAGGSPTIARAAVAEAVGTALLLAVIVGSGVMGERLAGGNVAIALLANALATGGGLVAVIIAFGPVSGAHFNPVVTLCDAWQGGLPWRRAPVYIAAQLAGAVAGTWLAHAMFELPILQTSTHARHGVGDVVSECTATFGLLATIWGCARRRPTSAPFAVAAYVTAGYWFSASTALANPAVTIARSLTDTFSGIRPVDVPAFIAAQAFGGLLATALFAWLMPRLPERARDVVVPHAGAEGAR